MSTDDLTTTGRRTRDGATALGALAALLVVVSLFFEGPAELVRGRSGAAVRSYYQENADAIELLVLAESLATLGMLLLAVALTVLAHRAGASPLVTALTAIAGGLTVLWLWMQAAVDMVPLVMLDDDGAMAEYDDRTLLAVDLVGRIGETFGDVATVPRGLFVGAVSLAALQTRFLPRWLGWIGMVIAAASLVGVLGVALFFMPGIAAWFAGLFGFVLWTAALGVVMGLRAARNRGSDPSFSSA
jgi:hypothetical protein